MAFKRARIEDFRGKSSGFADFENTLDRGFAVILTRIRNCTCLMFGSWVQKGNLDHRSSLFFQLWLAVMLMSSSKLFLFSNEAHVTSGVRLLLKLHCVIVPGGGGGYSHCRRGIGYGF